MTVHWTVAAQAAACGLGGVVLVFVCRLFRNTPPLLTPLSALSVFLGFALIPSIPVLFQYPFVHPKPDLEPHSLYLVLSALALTWAVYETFRQGLK